MIRFLLLFALVYLTIQLARFFHNIKRYSSPSSPPRLSGVMVKDEVCETYIPEEEAIKEKIDGKIYYFCSQECRRRFLKERKNRQINQRSA